MKKQSEATGLLRWLPAPVALLLLLLPGLAVAQSDGNGNGNGNGNGSEPAAAGVCVTCPDPEDPPPTPPALDATFASQTVGSTMVPGQAQAVVVRMTNVGSQTWAANSTFKLGSQNPVDNMTWGAKWVTLTSSVATGQSATFSFNVTAPAVAGSYNFQWRMINGTTWFGAASTNVVVAVASNSPPTVQLTSPANGGSTAAPASITLNATAADTGGSIASVAFYSNGVLAGTDVSAPYSLALTGLGAGAYQFKAIATDNANASTTSATASFTVTASGGTAAVSATRSYVYDEYERLCKTVNPESGATIVGYDAVGNVAWTVDGSPLTALVCDRASVSEADKTIRRYDAMNRLESITTPDGKANVTTTYFADGQVRTLTAGNPGGTPVVTTYAYNKRRLLVTESSSNGSTLYTLGYGYDANGHQASLTYPDGQVAAYAPDALGRATKVAVGAANYASGIGYFPGGAISGFTYGNGIVHTMTQNTRRLPTRSRDVYNTVKALDDTYVFDANGNVTDITDLAQNGLTTRGMAYDGVDRLKTVVSPKQWGDAVYTYDALDNIRSARQGTRDYRYNYDVGTNRLANIRNPAGAVQFALGYDTSGNVTSKNSQVLSFDDANRLNAVVGSQSYRYDGQGRRVQTTDADGKTTFWIYSQSGQLVYTSEGRRSQNLSYFYLGNSQVATRAVAWGTGAVTVRYQHTDSLGSPVAETDQARTIVKRNSYAPYGEAYGATVIDGTGYTGHVIDRGTGLTYMQQRYYDPITGRFISLDPVTPLSDPVGYFGRYHYAASNPYKFTDPDGRAWGLAAKVVKVIAKGGDVAATVAGAVEDGKVVFSRDATLGQRLVASASLASEVISPVSARDVKAGVAAVKGASSGADAKRATTLVPGPYSRESIPAHRGRPSAGEQRQINAIGDRNGCHTCGAPDPGTRSGNWIGDHQPAQALADPLVFLPHCNHCKAVQGGQVLQELRKRDK